MKSEFFYHLTPDIVMQAIEKSGLEPTGHCLTLNSFENRVYDITLEDESHVVAKFYRPGRWNEAQILEEHTFLRELVEGEIPACAPRLFPDGTTLHETEGIYFAIWNRTGGRAADELSDTDLSILGRLLARIHNTGQAHESVHRIRLTGETYGLEPCDYLDHNGFLPPHLRERYTNAVREIVNIYETVSADVPIHRIHGDCHLGNLLNGRDGWFFLDFDDFLTGPAVQDVWMLVPARDSEGLRQREVFLDAYRQFRNFDNRWLRLIEPLRALRYIRYAAWVARRWEDPAFPIAFPHFGTPQYWEDETRDLEEQVEYFHEHTDDIPQSIRREERDEPESDLTNKDFFWDWDQ
ncbi:MAG TPA: serine/threonine protein kinase [Spirochaetota bacterium]